MSKTDKTKPPKVQIAESKAKHGEAHINWHTDVTFRRYKGDGEYIAEQRGRKWVDHKDNYDGWHCPNCGWPVYGYWEEYCSRECAQASVEDAE